MIILTLSRFVGDTTFSFVLRVRGTFIGALLGLLLWSIGAGDGRGNAIGIGAVCAVAFPPMLFFRAYFKTPLTSILTLVTTILVLGYSCDVGLARFALTLQGPTPALYRRSTSDSAGQSPGVAS